MTDLRAYKIMFRFLEDRYSCLPSDDLGALLGELSLQEDGKPEDLAIVKDWERAVAAVDPPPESPPS
jgi:hypothetical protein